MRLPLSIALASSLLLAALGASAADPSTTAAAPAAKPAAASAAPAAKPAAPAAIHCRDAKGKFIACPTKPAATKHCRDAKGKFIACAK